MIVYEPWGTEEHQWVMPAEDQGYRAITNMLKAESGKPVGDRWRPPHVRLLTEVRNERLQHADLPWYSNDAMAVTRRARVVLEEVAGADAEFLPLSCDEEDLWLMHAWRVVNALDLRLCDVKLFSSGRIMSVTRYAFREMEIRGLTCFTDPRLRSIMFVTDAIVAAVKEAGLTGGGFRKLWQSQEP
jgi:hypothetical protein